MKTSRLKLLALTMCLMGVLVAAPVNAQDMESPLSFSLDTTFASQYLWRGFVPNSTPALQPNISLGIGEFSISSWSSINQQIEGWGQNWIEHDLTLDYSHSFGKVGVSGGYIWYLFPGIKENPGRDSHEFYVGASVDTLLAPSFTYYRDFDEGDGDYLYASIGHSEDLGDGVTLNLGTGVGLNHHQWIDITTVSDWDINVSVDIPWGKVTFSPFFTQMIGNETIFGKHNMFGVNMSVLSF